MNDFNDFNDFNGFKVKILGIETSTDVGSLALVEGKNVLARGDIDTHLRHSSRLIPLLDELLREAGWTAEELEGIGVGLGPGSFTGIRVGLAVGRGLAYGLKIPLAGAGSFAALARAVAAGNGRVVVISDARRGRLYGALYEKNGNLIRELKAPRLINNAEAIAWSGGASVVSPHWKRLRSVLPGVSGREVFPRAEWVARITEERLKNDSEVDPEELKPIYLSSYSSK